MVQSRFSQQFTVVAPALDWRRHRSMVPVGALTKAVGVDGRFSGSIRRFPGMKRLGRITSVAGNAISDIQFFRYVSFQKGNSSTIVRGFVVVAKDTVTSLYNAELHYSEGGGTFTNKITIAANVGTSQKCGVSSCGKFLLFAREGAALLVVFYNGSAWKSITAGPQTVLPPDPDTAKGTTGGVLSDGTYQVAYRYYSTQRFVYSGMSNLIEVELDAGTSTQFIRVSETDGVNYSEHFDKVELWRTLPVEVAGSSYSGGVLFRVGTMDVTYSGDPIVGSWSYDIGDTDGLVDVVLAQQDYYDPLLEAGGIPPKSGCVEEYQEVLFLGGTTETALDDSRSQVRWSPVNTYSPENFPPENVYRLPTTDHEIMGFQRAGDFLYVLTKAGLYRIQRAGNYLSFRPMHQGRGPVSRDAWAAIDESLMMVTSMGILLLDAGSSTLQLVGALDRLFLDENMWVASLSNVSMALDSVLGALFILNPDEEEAALVWQNTNSCTTLEDCNFEKVTAGVHPVAGGGVRAFFITDSGLIVYPDAARENTKWTMLGVGGTVNSTTTSEDTTSPTTILQDSGAAFDTTNGLKDCYLHILTGDLEGESRIITSNTATSITVGTAFDSAIEAGVEYSVSPVPFKIRWWPIAYTNDGGYPRDMLKRWKVVSFSVLATDYAKEYDGMNWTVGLFRQNSETMDVTASVAMDANVADSYMALALDGLQVEPGLEQMNANVDFELIAIGIDGMLTTSRDVSAS